jgi:hypothetical protein
MYAIVKLGLLCTKALYALFLNGLSAYPGNQGIPFGPSDLL